MEDKTESVHHKNADYENDWCRQIHKMRIAGKGEFFSWFNIVFLAADSQICLEETGLICESAAIELNPQIRHPQIR